MFLDRFDVLMSKNNFKKIKKYYFYIFLNKIFLKSDWTDSLKTRFIR